MKQIYFLFILLFSFSLAEGQTRTLNTNDAVGTLPGVFSVNTNGAATYYIPIKLPKGLGGLTPTLGLSYNSQTKNGILGMGWSLSGLSAVGRAGENLFNDNSITPVSFDNNDKFTLDGQRLIPTNGALTEYRTEQESFSKIIVHGSDVHNPDWFEVRTRAGLIEEYGRDESSNNSSFVPRGTTSKLLWRVNRIEDQQGNYFDFFYSTDYEPQEVTKIIYSGNLRRGATPSYEVDFSYTTRNDDNTLYVSGTNFSHDKLLSGITVKYNGQTVQSYQITYDQTTMYPRISSISTTDANGNTMNPTLFTYGSAQSGFSQLSTSIYKSGQDAKYTLGDFNGDGLEDIACIYYTMNNGSPVYTSWTIYYSNGDGTFTQGVVHSLPSDFVEFVSGDFNGDGKTDLVKITRSKDVFYLSLSSSSINDSIVDQTGFWGNEWPNPVDFRAVDINGDGKEELMVTSLLNGNGRIWSYELNATNYFTSIFNQGLLGNDYYSFTYPTSDVINPVSTGNFTGDRKTDVMVNVQASNSIILEYNETSRMLEEINSGGYSTPTSNEDFYVGDFNGDGISDIFTNNTVYYFDGKLGWVTGPSISIPGPQLYYSYSDTHTTLSDFNGDGKTDVLITNKEYYFNPHNIGTTKQFVQMNWFVYYSTGTGFKEESFATYDETDTVYTDGDQFFDSNGDGKSECLSRDGANGALKLAFFHKDEDLYSIQQISNGLDENINISYRALDDPNFSTASSSYQYPLYNYDGPLKIVSKVLEDNGLGGSFEKDYSFAGYVRNHLRTSDPGFLGLSLIDHSSNSETDTWFNILNSNGYYYKYPNKVLQYGLTSQGWENTAALIMKRTDTVEMKNTIPGNSSIYYPVITQQVTKYYDNESPDTFTKMETDTQSIGEIDNWGNSLQHTVTISNNEQGTAYNTTTYESSFSQNMDTTDWIINRPDYTIVTNQYVNDSKNYTVRTNYTYYATGQQSWPLISNIEVIPNNDTKYRTETALEYDIYGNMTKKTVSTPDLSVATNPPLISRETDYGYNESTYAGGFLTSVTKYNGSTSFTSTFQYNLSDGTLSKSTDANGLTTSYEYGPFSQLIKVVNPNGSSTAKQLLWASSSSVSSLAPSNAVYALSTTNPDHSQQVVFYDKLGRVVRKIATGLTNTQWIGTDNVYDSRGFLEMVSEPYFSTSPPSQSDASQWTTYTRNSLNNKVTSVASPTSTVNISYSGLQTSVANTSTGVTTITTVDPLGRKISVVDPTGTISYQYYSNGELKSADAAGSTTTITYDDAGRKQQIVDPNSGTTQYSFSNFGQLLSQTDNKGNKYQMAYDELGRIKSKTLTNTSTVTTYTYNDVSGTNGFGALKSVAGPNSITYQYTYNSLDQLTNKGETIDGVTYNTGYTYDSLGQINQLSYPSGYLVKYVYSNSGALSQVQDAGNNVLWSATSISRRGQLTQYSLGNGLTTTEQFNDLDGTPESIITQNGQGTKVQDLTYSFDAGTGNLLSRTDVLHNLTENFGYDNILHSRLTSWQVSGQTTYTATLANNGNILTKSDVTSGGQYVYGSTSSINAVEKVTQPTTDFEQNAYAQNITYTAFDKISTIQQTNTVSGQTHNYNYSLEYGPDFARKKSVLTEDGVTQDTKYYIGDNYEVETDAGGKQRKLNYLYGGDGLFAIYVENNNADTMYYIQKNYLGSYYCVTNASGSIVTMDGQQQVYSFDPWGRRRNSTTWTFSNVPQSFLFDRGFTGQEHLDVFGLINLNGRAYDPWLGRMLSVDPVVENYSNTQSFNSYTYALNNPFKYVDPSGYYSVPPDWLVNMLSGNSGGGGVPSPGMMQNLDLNPTSEYVSASSDFADYASETSYIGEVYHFDWGSGNYENQFGDVVSWNSVNNSVVQPNASPLNSYQEGAIEEAIRDGLEIHIADYNKALYVILSDGDVNIGYYDGGLVSSNLTAGVLGLAAQEDPYTLLSQRIAESSSTTLSEFIAYGPNSRTVTGNILERNGPGSVKVKSHVRIPAGIYAMKWTPTTPISSWMGPATYEIVNGPLAARGIRLHVGNKYKDTVGCLLPGCSSGYSDGNYYVNSSGEKLNEIENLFGEQSFTLIVRNIP